ncbi:MAG: nicotinate (nicotinamide) nucleotide adenylyltransferase [Spirochaetaceae bacterium]
MRLAILGGTFNPPHLGHLFFANEVRELLKYDKIIFVPSAISAHKINDKSIKDSHRLNMIKLAVEDFSWASVSDCDIIRGGITRTVDTIHDISLIFNLKHKPGFIIGADLVKGFSNWRDPEIIADKSDLIVGKRDSEDVSLKYKHFTVNNKIFPLSSTEIRNRVLEGKSINFLLPEKVIKYIEKNELYK